MTRFARWVEETRGLELPDYAALWHWSVHDLDGFWGAVWEHFGVRSTTPVGPVLAAREMPGAVWFPGTRLNYAEHVLRGHDPDTIAIRHASELRPLSALSWADLAERTARIAAGLRVARCRRGRPCRRVPAEHPGGGGGLPRLRLGGCDLVELLARLRRAQRRRPVRPDRAEGAPRRRRLPLRRPRLRPARDPRGSAVRAADARAHRGARLPRPGAEARRSALRDRLGRAGGARRRSASRPSQTFRSSTRSGCSTAPARPVCRKRSCTGTAASCSRR